MNFNFWPKEIADILSVGRSLEDIGSTDWGLTKDDSILAIKKLKEMGIPVLSGHVLNISGDSVNFNYDSWICDKEHGEDKTVFLKRSITHAIKYIEEYPFKNVLFTIYPDLDEFQSSK